MSTQEYSLSAGSTTLTTQTDRGVFALTLDINAVTSADQFSVQAYEKAVSGGTRRVLNQWTFGATSTFGLISTQDKVVQLPVHPGGLLLGNGWEWTVYRISGTNRALPYTLWRIS